MPHEAVEQFLLSHKRPITRIVMAITVAIDFLGYSMLARGQSKDPL